MEVRVVRENVRVMSSLDMFVVSDWESAILKMRIKNGGIVHIVETFVDDDELRFT